MLKAKTVQMSVSRILNTIKKLKTLSFINNFAQKFLQIVKRVIFYINKSEKVQLHFRIPVFSVQFVLRKV